MDLETITGVVRSTTGDPIEGVLVMSLDLAYSETDSDGHFELSRPEMALVCWCDGFYPTARPVNGSSVIDITMRPITQGKKDSEASPK